MTHRDASTTVDAELRWRPAPLVFMLAVCAAAALALAVVLGSWQLIVFAAPLLGVLATAPWQQSSTRIQVDGGGTLRCFEAEEVVLVDAKNRIVNPAAVEVPGPRRR